MAHWSTHLHQKHIIVIDDDAVYLERYLRDFTDKGYKVTAIHVSPEWEHRPNETRWQEADGLHDILRIVKAAQPCDYLVSDLQFNWASCDGADVMRAVSGDATIIPRPQLVLHSGSFVKKETKPTHTELPKDPYDPERVLQVFEPARGR